MTDNRIEQSTRYVQTQNGFPKVRMGKGYGSTYRTAYASTYLLIGSTVLM